MKIARFCRARTALSASALAVLLTAAGLSAVSAAAPANMVALMMEVVGPAVQPIWDGSYADKLTDQDWERIKKAAADLAASEQTIAVGGPAPAERQRANSPAWKEWYGKFTAAVTDANRAANAKDQMALATAGDTLVEVCEGCHTAFPAAAPQ